MSMLSANGYLVLSPKLAYFAIAIPPQLCILVNELQQGEYDEQNRTNTENS